MIESEVRAGLADRIEGVEVAGVLAREEASAAKDVPR
jgi:hypothetical protein